MKNRHINCFSISMLWKFVPSPFAGVYTEVSSFNGWIDETIAKDILPDYEFAIDSVTEESNIVAVLVATPTGSSSIVSPCAAWSLCAVFLLSLLMRMWCFARFEYTWLLLFVNCFCSISTYTENGSGKGITDEDDWNFPANPIWIWLSRALCVDRDWNEKKATIFIGICYFDRWVDTCLAAITIGWILAAKEKWIN